MVRLRDGEVKTIKEAILRIDSDAVIYLFGSRADDTKKGGDIDLLVLSKVMTSQDKTHILFQLYDAIGEQKIDLLIANEPKTAFEKLAFETGVRL